ncbi:UNVERIFIED_ORG: adhesin isopeptide-forming family sspB-C2 type protein [Leuconostoc holzapfelii]
MKQKTKRFSVVLKTRRNWQAGMMTAAVLLPLATGISSVVASDGTPSPVKVSTAGTKIHVDDSALQQAITQAKDTGVLVQQSTTGSQTTKSDNLKAATDTISQDYTSQADKILTALKQQKSLNDKFASDTQTYNDQKAQYDKDKAQYDKDEATYKQAQAAYDASLAKQKENATKPGYAKSAIVQALQLNAEGHANVNIHTTNNLSWGYNGKLQATPSINPASDYRTNPNSGKNSDGDQVEFYETALSQKQSVDITYNNLTHSSYNNRKITKLVRTLSYGSNGNNDPIGLAIANDPTVGFWYLGGSGSSGSFDRSVNVVDKYYYADGSQVELQSKDAYISAGSLNNYYGGSSNEHIERVKANDSTFLPINGSSITDNGGWLNALKDNSTGVNGGLSASDWDKNTAPNRYYGAGIYSFDSGVKDIAYTASTIESTDDGGKKTKATWFTQSTTLPVEAAIIPPAEPKAPVAPKAPTKPEPISVSYQLTDLYVTPQPIKDVDLGTNNGDKTGSDNDKKVVKGQDLTYSLKSSDLPANREDDVKTFKYVDVLPKQVDYKSAKLFSPDGKTDLTDQFEISYDQQSHTVTFVAKTSYLQEMNRDKTKAFTKAVADVYVTTNTDNSKFDNTFTEFVNDDKNESNAVHNTTPDVKPLKQDLDGAGKDINNQDVKPGAHMNYQLTWDLTDLKDAVISDDILGKGLSFSDDYDETKLNVTAETKTTFTIIDTETTKSVASEVTVSWDEQAGKWTVKANDAQAFLKAHAGHKLAIAFHPVVKDDATGELINTAVQNDFGQDYQTNTVKNNITPNPEAPKTPNTSYGEKPKGGLYAAIASILLIVGGVVFRKPIAKWLHK